MAERVDEWAMNFVHEFDGTPLKNVSKGAVDLGDLQDAEEKKALEQAAEQFKPIVEKLSDSLKAKTKEVRVTTRLVDSPACLVTSEIVSSTYSYAQNKQGKPYLKSSQF